MLNKKKQLVTSLLSLCAAGSGFVSNSLHAALRPADFFTCRVTSTGQNLSENTPGSAIVRVNLTPDLQAGQNLVVDMSNEIMCRNNTWESKPGGGASAYGVFTRLTSGTTFNGALANFTGSVFWRYETSPLPLTSSTFLTSIEGNTYKPLPLRLYLSPIGAAGGIMIKSGDLIASLNMQMYSSDPNRPERNFVWNIYANNNVVVPTGGCDVSARNVTVNLPEYPGSETAIPLTVHCASNQAISYYLTGTIASGSSSVFINTASAQPASGIGIQILRNGTVLSTNKNVSLGTVGSAPVSLGLTANYARTTGRITAGKVQSVIGVTFVYD
ncbi:TPA: fimbrial protein [Klebsiella oxytoca]